MVLEKMAFHFLATQETEENESKGLYSVEPIKK